MHKIKSIYKKKKTRRKNFSEFLRLDLVLKEERRDKKENTHKLTVLALIFELKTKQGKEMTLNEKFK